MSDVIGRGVIEVSADSRKLTAGIDDAKAKLKSLGVAAGDATKGQSQSIDRYVKSLGTIAVTAGKSGRELELYRLSLRGATAEQLKAADSALRMSEGYARGEAIGQRVRGSLLAIGTAATVAAGAWTAMIISSINAADGLNDLSKKTGVGVEDLSGLSLAAKQSGTDLEGVAASIAKLSVNMGKDPEKYRALGISAKDPIEAFKQLADIFAAVEDPQQRAALGAEALGKSWGSAAPLLSEGSKSIGEMIDKGKKLSGVTQETADQADKFNDQLAEMRAVTEGLGMKMAGEMLPALSDIAKAVKTAYEESGKLSAAWVALGSVGAFLFTDEFASTTAKIKKLQESLADLQAEKFMADKAPAVGAVSRWLFGSSDIDGDIAKTKASIKALQDESKPKPAAPKAPVSTVSTAGVVGFIKQPKTGADTSGQEARAQLGLDLENIKITSGQIIGAYANAEKILESLRAAGLVDEQDYYASKLEFLKLNGVAEEQSLTNQIARMERENLLGKEKIDNDKKIAEARAKRESVRASNGTGATSMGIQAEAASTKRTKEVDDFFAKAQEDAAARNVASVESIRLSLQTQQQAENESYILRLAELTTFRDARVENEKEGNRLIEEENRRHLKTLAETQQADDIASLEMTRGTADEVYSVLQKAGQDQTALGKTLFLANKAMAVAEIIMNANLAASKAEGQMGLFGIPTSTYLLATGYARAGMVAGMAIAEASARDGYDIPEGKNPLVQTHAKEMILPRAQANVIRDLAKDGTSKTGSSAITIVNNTSARIGKVTEQRLPNGERALIIEEAVSKAVSATAAQFGDPNSQTSRGLQRNFATQRSR